MVRCSSCHQASLAYQARDFLEFNLRCFENVGQSSHNANITSFTQVVTNKK